VENKRVCAAEKVGSERLLAQFMKVMDMRFHSPCSPLAAKVKLRILGDGCSYFNNGRGYWKCAAGYIEYGSSGAPVCVPDYWKQGNKKSRSRLGTRKEPKDPPDGRVVCLCGGTWNVTKEESGKAHEEFCLGWSRHSALAQVDLRQKFVADMAGASSLQDVKRAANCRYSMASANGNAVLRPSDRCV
jgi:hypothetical protein